MKTRYWALLIPLAPFLLALGQEAVKPVFVDVTKQAGISFTHCLGDDEINTIVEATGSGCAFLDYDGDGFMDIYAVNGCYLEGVNDPESRFKGAAPHRPSLSQPGRRDLRGCHREGGCR